MVASKQGLDLFQASGEPYEIGYRLGELARPVFAGYMRQSRAWQAVRRWRGAPFVHKLREAAHAHFPALLVELDGMAAGLGWTAEDMFLWNCRGELIHNVPDGCTTLAAHVGDTRFIAHNEDGDPFLGERCALVEVRPAGKPGFVSFHYPGSLPGHTFAASRAGVVQAINNLRIRAPVAGVPRMILARAVLDAASLDEALHILRDTPAASGFHHTLSRPLQPAALLDVLQDRAPSGLPIYRDDPLDPDGENTLATALFEIGGAGVSMKVYRQGQRAFDAFIARAACGQTGA